MWPTAIHYPHQKKFHRNWEEFIFRKQQTIGTRKDCVARSAALSINTDPNKDGLVEAVTCDLYDFGKHRRSECVCFPIYDDYVTKTLVPYRGVLTETTTTSTFYPPPVVVQNALLAAAIAAKPTPCVACISPANVVRHTPAPLGGFPYCPTPGPVGNAGFAPMTNVETITIKKHHKWTTITSTFPGLPTTAPNCNVKSYVKHGVSACAIDQCMWDFIQSYTTVTSDWVTFPDAWSNPVRMGWNTTFYLVETPHWGVYVPMTKNPTSVSRAMVTDPWSSKFVGIYSEYQTSLSLPAPTPNKKELKKQEKAAKKKKPVCCDEKTCWQWCRKRVEGNCKQYYWIFGVAIGVATAALTAMLINLCCRKYRARKAKDPKRRKSTMEMVEIETERGPVLEMFEAPKPLGPLMEEMGPDIETGSLRTIGPRSASPRTFGSRAGSPGSLHTIRSRPGSLRGVGSRDVLQRKGEEGRGRPGSLRGVESRDMLHRAEEEGRGRPGSLHGIGSRDTLQKMGEGGKGRQGSLHGVGSRDTLQKTAEEGRGRYKMRAFPEDRVVEAEHDGSLRSDGASDGVRKVSGRQVKFAISDRGSIRNRKSSYEQR